MNYSKFGESHLARRKYFQNRKKIKFVFIFDLCQGHSVTFHRDVFSVEGIVFLKDKAISSEGENNVFFDSGSREFLEEIL